MINQPKIKKFRIPVFVPHKGCPHDCVFCNQHKITGQTTDMTPEIAGEIIETHLQTIEKYNTPGSYYVETAFFGGSFTAVDSVVRTELLKTAGRYVDSGRVHGIRCSTRPDCIDNDIIAECLKYGMTAIELGVQSADDEVLKLSGRGHTFDSVIKASELIKNAGIELGLQMMTGLPGDTFDKSVETANKIAALKPQCVRIYPTLVMEGTHLEAMYQSGTYSPRTLSEAVELVSHLVGIFESQNIEILRIGLQTTDGVNSSTVKGPYHPAFAELVYGRIMRQKIEKYIESHGLSDTVLEIDVADRLISQTVGHRRENVLYFKQKYNIEIKINQNKGICI